MNCAMLVLAILSILQFGFVINKPISHLVSRKDFDPEASAIRLDALYSRYEKLREKHEKPKPVWPRAPEQVTEVTEEYREPLIGTRKGDRKVVSEPWVKRVFLTPFKNPLILAIKMGNGRYALNVHRQRIIEAERDVISTLTEGYSAMLESDLDKADEYLKQAVKQDRGSQALQKSYYEVNAPVINFQSYGRYKQKYRKFEEWKEFSEKLHQEKTTKKFEKMRLDRREMEEKWQHGDNRVPDPNGVFLRSDVSARPKAEALKYGEIGLAHETYGRKALKDQQLALAEFHWKFADKYYTLAQQKMEKVYGTQYGYIDLRTCNQYNNLAMNLESNYPLASTSMM